MTADALHEETPVVLHEVAPIVPGAAQPEVAPESLDTVRALCHDLRQPLSAIRLLAEANGGDVRRRLDGILDQAQWLADLVEGVIGDAVDDQPTTVDVVELVSRCVLRAQLTADCEIAFTGTGSALADAAPVALGRAFSCVLDNAVRAAGPAGHVAAKVTDAGHQIVIRVIDDGPGLGHVPAENSLGLTITRALIGACDGGFELTAGTAGGTVARIVIPASESGRSESGRPDAGRSDAGRWQPHEAVGL